MYAEAKKSKGSRELPNLDDDAPAFQPEEYPFNYGEVSSFFLNKHFGLSRSLIRDALLWSTAAAKSLSHSQGQGRHRYMLISMISGGGA